MMRQAVPSRLRGASVAHPEANRRLLSIIAFWQPGRDNMAGGPVNSSRCLRTPSGVAGLTSRLALVKLRPAPHLPTATAGLAEPPSAVTQQHALPHPAAAPRNVERTEEQQASVTQHHVIVNFYHLTDIANPDRVCLHRCSGLLRLLRSCGAALPWAPCCRMS